MQQITLVSVLWKLQSIPIKDFIEVFLSFFSLFVPMLIDGKMRWIDYEVE